MGIGGYRVLLERFFLGGALKRFVAQSSGESLRISRHFTLRSLQRHFSNFSLFIIEITDSAGAKVWWTNIVVRVRWTMDFSETLRYFSKRDGGSCMEGSCSFSMYPVQGIVAPNRRGIRKALRRLNRCRVGCASRCVAFTANSVERNFVPSSIGSRTITVRHPVSFPKHREHSVTGLQRGSLEVQLLPRG